MLSKDTELTEREVHERYFTTPNGTELKAIFEFPIAWLGWECDSKAWIVEDKEGERYVVQTNHGTPYISSKTALLRKIEDYIYWTAQIREALIKLDPPEDVP